VKIFSYFEDGVGYGGATELEQVNHYPAAAELFIIQIICGYAVHF
jgi:hypothetical protein